MCLNSFIGMTIGLFLAIINSRKQCGVQNNHNQVQIRKFINVTEIYWTHFQSALGSGHGQPTMAYYRCPQSTQPLFFSMLKEACLYVTENCFANTSSWQMKMVLFDKFIIMLSFGFSREYCSARLKGNHLTKFGIILSFLSNKNVRDCHVFLASSLFCYCNIFNQKKRIITNDKRMSSEKFENCLCWSLQICKLMCVSLRILICNSISMESWFCCNLVLVIILRQIHAHAMTTWLSSHV